MLPQYIFFLAAKFEGSSKKINTVKLLNIIEEKCNEECINWIKKDLQKNNIVYIEDNRE
jgi:hypothetical protein